MSDHATRQAKRSGDLAAQLASEVRAGRPERARLRAYCGCEAARFVLGPCRPMSSDLACLVLCSDTKPLSDWLSGLQHLAWAPPRLNVDPAQWVLTVAATATGWATQQHEVHQCANCRWGVEGNPNMVALCLRHLASSDALTAAEDWTRCPRSECLAVWESRYADYVGLPWLPHSDSGPEDFARQINAAAQIIGPDAAREAAARAVLTALED